jgi:hypothetical protein
VCGRLIFPPLKLRLQYTKTTEDTKTDLFTEVNEDNGGLTLSVLADLLGWFSSSPLFPSVKCSFFVSFVIFL